MGARSVNDLNRIANPFIKLPEQIVGGAGRPNHDVSVTWRRRWNKRKHEAETIAVAPSAFPAA